MPHKGESAHFFSQLLPPCILIFRQGSRSLLLSLARSLSLSLSYSHLHSGELPRELSSPGAHKLSCLSHKPVSSGKAKASDSETNANTSSSSFPRSLCRAGRPRAPVSVSPMLPVPPARRGGGAGARPGSGPFPQSRAAARGDKHGPDPARAPAPRHAAWEGGKRRLVAPGAAPSAASALCSRGLA